MYLEMNEVRKLYLKLAEFLWFNELDIFITLELYKIIMEEILSLVFEC